MKQPKIRVLATGDVYDVIALHRLDSWTTLRAFPLRELREWESLSYVLDKKEPTQEYKYKDKSYSEPIPITPNLSFREEQEDLHTLLWKAFTILCNKDTRSEEDGLMRKQLEMWLEDASMKIDFVKQKEQEDKIEKIDIDEFTKDQMNIDDMKCQDWTFINKSSKLNSLIDKQNK